MARGVFNIALGLALLWFLSVLTSEDDGSAERCSEEISASVMRGDSTELDLSHLTPGDDTAVPDC